MTVEKLLSQYRSMNIIQLEKVFNELLSSNAIEEIKWLDDNGIINQLDSPYFFDMILRIGEDNNIELLDFLMKSPSFTHHITTEKFDILKKTLLKNASDKGHIDMVRYLINSPEIEKTNQYSPYEILQCYFKACDKGYLSIIQYVLGLDKIHEDKNYKKYCDIAFRVACHHSYLDIVRYVLTSPDLKEYANIHTKNDSVIINAINNKNEKIVNFLIFEMNIGLTPNIQEVIEENPHIMKLFEVRGLNNKLKKKDDIIGNKIKI